MSDDITQKLRVTMPDFKGLEISCPCRIRSSLMKEAADEIEKLTRERNEARAEVERLTRQRDEARAALKPFASLFLWPDDLDSSSAADIRADEDWSETENDAWSDDPWIRRGDIRAARKAREAKP